jgi:hypothetical protein
MRDVIVVVRHHEGLTGWALTAFALAIALIVYARQHRLPPPWSSR